MKDLLDRKAELQKDLDALIKALASTMEAMKKCDAMIKLN